MGLFDYVTKAIEVIGGFRATIATLQSTIAARDAELVTLRAENAKLKNDLAQDSLDDAALEAAAASAIAERDMVQAELDRLNSLADDLAAVLQDSGTPSGDDEGSGSDEGSASNPGDGSTAGSEGGSASE